jgi:E3 ubiquitin-protein ligase ATL10/75/76/77/78
VRRRFIHLADIVSASGVRARAAMRMLSDGPTGDDAWAGRTMLPAEAGDGDASVYPDSNMVVILAALMCVLICAFGLNSLRHCGRSLLAMGASPSPVVDTAAAAMVVITAPAAVAGLNKKELRKIPVVEYETSEAGGLPGTECAICLGEFVDGERVRLLPRCHHGFHVECIDMWLAAHSSCPICRSSLLKDDHGAGEPTVTGDE